jgi:hypothetical protein
MHWKATPNRAIVNRTRIVYLYISSRGRTPDLSVLLCVCGAGDGERHVSIVRGPVLEKWAFVPVGKPHLYRVFNRYKSSSTNEG